jgi:hypothetical protein
MGFFSFVKKIFTAEDADEKELDAARARHGIQLDARDKAEMNKYTPEEERFGSEYDAWEDLKNMRSSFFIGSWASRKFRVVGQDKVKKDLEELAKKREEQATKQDWDTWERDKDKRGQG